MPGTVTRTGTRADHGALRIDVDAVVDRLYAAHPEWLERWGDEGRRRAVEDVTYTVEFLNAAVRSGVDEVFARYTWWFTDVLEARDVPRSTVIESYEQLAKSLDATRDVEEHAVELLRSNADRLRRDDRPDWSDPDTMGSDEPDVTALVDALLAGDGAHAYAALEGEASTPEAFAQQVVRMATLAMYEVGRRWVANEISVSREHLATATLQTTLARISAENVVATLDKDATAVLACVEGNQHSVGLRLVGDLLLLAGWNVQYLGADVPLEALKAQVDEVRPRVVALSLSLPQHIPILKRTLDSLDAMTPKPMIIVGGRPVHLYSGIGEGLGADLAATEIADILQLAKGL